MANTNSYMITNRATPGATSYSSIVPLSGANAAGLWWYMSGSPYDQNPKNYIPQSSNPSDVPPSTFLNAIVAQLKSQAKPMLTVFIHGLGNLWNDAITGTATFGSNMTKQGYTGLVIGFSWPSYDETESGAFYASTPYAFPPTKTSGTIRDNINGSRKSFGNLMSFLENLMVAVPNLRVSMACHSEGNYMLMTGMYQLTCVKIDQIIMLAADINNAAFQIPAQGLTGQGSYIAPNANRITVYYSASDNILTSSESMYETIGYHNPIYGGRMGQVGPSWHYGKQQVNSNGVDCSLVVNESNIDNLINKGVIPSTNLHSSYMLVPQILKDMTQTINDVSSGQIINRTPTADTNSYLMNPTS